MICDQPACTVKLCNANSHLFVNFQIQLGSNFFFRCCGWPSTKPKPAWSIEDKHWIIAVDKLMENLFGKESLEYHYDKKRFAMSMKRMYLTMSITMMIGKMNTNKTLTALRCLLNRLNHLQEKRVRQMSHMKNRSRNPRGDAFFLLKNQIFVQSHKE